MRTRSNRIAVLVAALLLAEPSFAQDGGPKISLDLKAGSLGAALRQLSSRSGVGLLFAPDVVGNRRSVRISGTMTLEEALRRLLEGSGLSFRRTATGTIVIFAVDLDTAEPAYPEILVVGQRTQNTDIRRTENDVQPYQVMTSRDIAGAQVDNLDQFLRRRLPSNASLEGPAQIPASNRGSNRSEVNLHGLGADQTLVLIDGMRLPGLPLSSLQLDQPDLNGIPLIAIDRIETLTGTAGGIHGPGAIGGTINVVIRRDYRGADFSFVQGLSDRGDAHHSRVEGRVGFTPDSGSTDFMFAFARSHTDGLREGDRGYSRASRAIEIRRDPVGFVSGFSTGNGVIVRSLSRENLTLKPQFGGRQLGSAITYLPIDPGAVTQDVPSILLANAGKVPADLSPDANGATRSLTANTTVSSLLLNVRRRFGANVEAFVDLIAYDNRGRVTIAGSLPPVEPILGSTTTNPFEQTIFVALPTPGFDTEATNRLQTARLTGGLIARLPLDWRAEGNFSLGWVRNTVESKGFALDRSFSTAIGLNGQSAGGAPPPDPFGDWGTFLTALEAYRTPVRSFFERQNRMEQASLRLAGPLLERDAGIITLSLLADRRREKVSASTDILRADGIPTSNMPNFTLTTNSLYAETRVPLASKERVSVLRGLELQFAARYDGSETEAPTGEDLFDKIRANTKKSGIAYTAGVRFFPARRVLIRGSIATGALPPTPEQMLSNGTTYQRGWLTSQTWRDPKRANTPLTLDGPLKVSLRGSRQLKPERARSLSMGLVVNPEGGSGLRISLDYTHISKSAEFSNLYALDLGYFLANEDRYPDRVIRAALTPADIAAGYSGGVLAQIDTSALNIGRTWIDAVDVQFDYEMLLKGRDSLRFYGAGTWQPRLRRRPGPEVASVNYVGFADGALRWRGNAGAEWSSDRLSLGVNGQFYAGYYAGSAETIGDLPLSRRDITGLRIPSQFYADLNAAYDFGFIAGTPVRRLALRLDVSNVFNQHPPIVTGSDLSYSAFGDPRGRRFALTVSGRF